MEQGSPFHGEGCFCYHIDCSDIVSACIDPNHDSKYLQAIFESQQYLSKSNVFNFQLNFFQPLLIFMCLYTYMNACHSICVEVRNDVQELALSFYYVSPRDQTQTVCILYNVQIKGNAFPSLNMYHLSGVETLNILSSQSEIYNTLLFLRSHPAVQSHSRNSFRGLFNTA